MAVKITLVTRKETGASTLKEAGRRLTESFNHAKFVSAKLVVTEEVKDAHDEGEAIDMVVKKAEATIGQKPQPQPQPVTYGYMEKLAIVKLVMHAAKLSLMDAKHLVEAVHDRPETDVDTFLGRSKAPLSGNYAPNVKIE